jgi:small subunit ribosomal protein S4
MVAKFKISRSLGCNLWGREKDPFTFKNYFPGQHGQSVVRVMSPYALQLRAKQRMRFYYLMTEKQFRKIFDMARDRLGDTIENLVAKLETRLDIVLYRGNFVPSMFAAKQLINHKHVMVNGRVVDIRSCNLKVGDVVSLTQRGARLKICIEALEKAGRSVPEYLKFDTDKKEISFVKIPVFHEVPYEVKMEPNLVVELYSK